MTFQFLQSDADLPTHDIDRIVSAAALRVLGPPRPVSPARVSVPGERAPLVKGPRTTGTDKKDWTSLMDMVRRGYSGKEIAARFELSQQRVSQIMAAHGWTRADTKAAKAKRKASM